MISGLCNIACHEGSAPRNFMGNALPTCKMIDACACTCHAVYTAMFEESGMTRAAVDNSGYIPDRGDFVMPDMRELAEARLASQSSTTVLERVESLDPTRAPSQVVRTYAPTPSGVAGRGELESRVELICSRYALTQAHFDCTPKWVSEQIAVEFNCKNPSVGAIGAVFDRWVKIDYADCRKSPVRFLGYTEQGLALGLDGCKERSRRHKTSVR